MTKRTAAWADVAMASALGAYFVYQLAAASRYPPEPALFPRLVGVLGVLLAAGVAWRALLADRPAPGDADTHERRWLPLAVAAPVSYALALWLLGYWLASGLALVLFPLMRGYRRFLLLLVVSAALLVFFGVLLSYLEVQLPKGLLFS